MPVGKKVFTTLITTSKTYQTALISLGRAFSEALGHPYESDEVKTTANPEKQ